VSERIVQSHSAEAPARLTPTASWVMLQSVDVAVVGLLGIIVGALLGGVVQVGVARVERRATTRRAARLLYGDHVIALSAVRSMAGMEFWWSDEAAPTLDGWRRYREDLAGAMPGPDFQTVDGAFYRVAGLEMWRRVGLAARNNVEEAHHTVNQLEAAGLILLRTGYRGKELDAMESELAEYHENPWADSEESSETADGGA